MKSSFLIYFRGCFFYGLIDGFNVQISLYGCIPNEPADSSYASEYFVLCHLELVYDSLLLLLSSGSGAWYLLNAFRVIEFM